MLPGHLVLPSYTSLRDIECSGGAELIWLGGNSYGAAPAVEAAAAGTPHCYPCLLLRACQPAPVGLLQTLGLEPPGCVPRAILYLHANGEDLGTICGTLAHLRATLG